MSCNIEGKHKHINGARNMVRKPKIMLPIKQRNPTLKQESADVFVIDIPEDFADWKKEFYGGIRGKTRGWKLTLTRHRRR